MVSRQGQAGVDQWVEEQMFEEDVRAVVSMLRPNRQERLLGWSDYRTGGKHFRATISWDQQFERNNDEPRLAVPCMTDVLESILVGSARSQDEFSHDEEFDLYRKVVRELLARLDDLQSNYG